MVWNVLHALLWTAGLSVFGIVLGLLFSGVDRILVARMQSRIGPPLIQPLLDTIKLLVKQDMVPTNAVTGVFRFAPVLALAGAITLLFYIPLGGLGALPVFEGRGDSILVLYLLLIPGLAMVMGGFASGSPYASIGAQREMVTMLSYELPLATVVLTYAWKLASLGLDQPFSLGTMAANPIWAAVGPLGGIGVFLMLGVMLLVAPGELGRIPFGSPEAETELAGGLLVEYSGRSLALFQLALAVKSVAFCALMVTLFAPWNLSQWVALPGPLSAMGDFLFFVAKSGIFMFFGVSLLRASVARLRITEIVEAYWKWIGMAALAALLLVMLDARI